MYVLIYWTGGLLCHVIVYVHLLVLSGSCPSPKAGWSPVGMIDMVTDRLVVSGYCPSHPMTLWLPSP
ncbi:hypothetical protein BDV26DRAFT_268282 [Aspergillus bertholletiae]|uniref:Uncharacterized protein n=1 Tax=Aspergillus bertholletiae TaxID=1226010 RepID=A0A5N7AZE2_9EURO|nr:hypothetical protein BDV26DRAFT_268282 [Aspergillus bertholletiae]